MTKIQIGTWLHCILHGGKNGVVYNITGEQRPETVKVIGGIMHTGGNAYFDVVWENGTKSLQVPESIVMGVQWQILTDEGIAATEEIQAMLGAAVVAEHERKTALEEKQEKFAADVKALKSNKGYAHLVQASGEYKSCGKLAGQNIRIELKRAFPGVKFSVRKPHYGTVYIGWTDGPTGNQVSAIVDKYSAGSFDGMQDLYEYDKRPFTEVFGDAKYISCSRTISFEAMKAAARDVAEETGLPLLKVSDGGSGSGYIDREDGGEKPVLFSVHEDNGKIIIAHDSRGEWYCHIVHAYAHMLSY